jgi:hypothetical protein
LWANIRTSRNGEPAASSRRVRAAASTAAMASSHHGEHASSSRTAATRSELPRTAHFWAGSGHERGAVQIVGAATPPRTPRRQAATSGSLTAKVSHQPSTATSSPPSGGSSQIRCHRLLPHALLVRLVPARTDQRRRSRVPGPPGAG